MKSKPRFLFDSNIVMTAANTYYAFDLAPNFWLSMLEHAQNGSVFTIDRVLNEVKVEGELKDWMYGPFISFVEASGTADCLLQYASLMQWARSKFKPSAFDQFAKATVADAWIVAYAKSVGATVVTLEKFSADAKARVLIPNACKFLGVNCVDTFEMLRILGIKVA